MNTINIPEHVHTDPKVQKLIETGKISFAELPNNLSTDNAKTVWSSLVKIRQAGLKKYHLLFMPDYLDSLDMINFSPENIPSISYINNFLQRSGWYCCWSNKLPEDDFFYLAAHKIFPITSYCRNARELERSVYPDFVHDLWGHVPMLHNQNVSNIIVALAEKFLRYEYNVIDKTINQAISSSAHEYFTGNVSTYDNINLTGTGAISQKKVISRLFLFLIEFGLLGQPENFQVVGGGILSSDKELNHVSSGNVPIMPMTKQALYDNEYCLHDKQKQYFTFDTLDHVPFID